jgi:tRNA(Ile)-lysidine synthase
VSGPKKAAPQAKQKRSSLGENVKKLLLEAGFLKAGERIGVAVSGGADSVALLRLLLELRHELGCVLSVVHFNHKLRGKASEKDQQFVADLAEKHGLEFIVAHEDIAARTKRDRGNLEAVARRARYRFFEQLRTNGRIGKIAVAHSADDQAETVLAHILRGTGLSGLRGIHIQTETVFRPLLGIRRAALRKYLKALGQDWREDATNQNIKRMRSRIRKRLLPVLEKKFNSGIVDHLCQLAELAGQDEGFLETCAAEWINRSIQQYGAEVVVPVADLAQVHRALRARIVRNILASVKSRHGQLSKAHIESVLKLAFLHDSGKTLQLPGGVEVHRERDLLRFCAIQHASKIETQGSRQDYNYNIDLPGGRAELRLVELSCLLHFREIDWPAEGRETSQTGAVFDRGRLRAPLVVRNWRPGDSMCPVGHQRKHTLARLLNEKSVSRWAKAAWPVLTSGGKIAWTRGLRESSDFAVGPETRKALVLDEESIK